VTTLDDDEVWDEELALIEPVDDEADEALDDEPAATRPSRRQVRRDKKVSARRVRRVVRRIDPWSVFKVSGLFYVCVWGIVVLASVLLWRAAVTSGSVDDVEGFIIDLGFDDFEFHPQQMFESLFFGGAIMVLVATFFTVLMTVLFNLICDLTGGVRIIMIEQDVADQRRRRPRRDPLA
jgi:Transmembrane domain of unknown function (DUF3566)